MTPRIHLRRDERGMALISAILVMMVVTTLGIGALAMANHSLTSTAINRKQVQSIGGAEAGIDLAINALQNPSPPCSLTGTLSSGPTTSSYSVAITYYDQLGNTLSCSAVQAGTSIPMSAQLSSTGDTSAAGFGRRVMKSLVNMTAVPSPAFDKAIFSQGNLTFTNKSTINGDGKNNANVYTNSSFTCTNNEYFYGNLYAQGDINGSNTCGATGDWWAAGRINTSGNGSIGGSLLAGGCNDTTKGCLSTASTSGNISMTNNYSVAKNATAKGTISPTPCGPGHVIQGTCSTSANPGNPPYQPFPTVNFDSAAWSAFGYTHQINEGSNCSQLTSDIQALSSPSATTPTVITTSCSMNWGSSNTWQFNTDVAVFATGGQSSSNQVNYQSTSSTVHNFYMIVPTDLINSQTPTSCSGSSGDIKYTNQVSITNLEAFVYTPCDVTFNNNQTAIGQVYGGGTVTVTNQFNMNFKSMTVPGAVGGTGSAPTSYSVGVVYIREG